MGDIDLFEGLTTGGADGNFGAGLPDFAWDAAVSTFTAINEAPASGSTRTVSPKDLFNDSAPPSAAFTNLTSPDINGPSPFGTDSYQTSPAFMTESDFASAHTDNWYPLFPDTTDGATAMPDAIQRTISDHSIQSSSSSMSPAPVSAGGHRKSLNLTDTPPSARHSAVAGVKPRRRKGPLADIALDPNDKVAYKRARNTLAARDSRQRKLEHVTTLENKIAELEEEVEKWKSIASQYGHAEL